MDNKYNIDTSKSLTVGRCKISKNITLSAHYHKQTEVVYVLSGAMSVCVNNNEYKIKKDQFAVIRPLDIHSFSILKEGTNIFLMILPDVYSINLSDVNITTKVFTEPNEDIKKITKMYKDFNDLGEKYMSHYYKMYYEALRELFVSNNKNTESNQSKIISYINNNISKNLTLNSVAHACNTNRSYVSRAINDFYGISFNQYINRLRISAFLDMYLNKDINTTIENIAADVGFNNIRTFYRAFSKELNCTPKEYLEMKI